MLRAQEDMDCCSIDPPLPTTREIFQANSREGDSGVVGLALIFKENNLCKEMVLHLEIFVVCCKAVIAIYPEMFPSHVYLSE